MLKFMKSILFAILMLSSGFAGEYPSQKINPRDSVHFGQAQAEVEHRLRKKAAPENSGIGRPGKDFVLTDRGIKLDFDSGILNGITFGDDFDFNLPIVAFIESWMNLDPIGDLRIKRGMKKTEFLKYFEAWEGRAKKLGIRRYDGNELLKGGEYRVNITEDKLLDMIHITFGPERSTGKGGTWGSGCTIAFVTPDALLQVRRVGTLDTISLFCDEFNTHARNPAKP
jgi:hypothetical protein